VTIRVLVVDDHAVVRAGLRRVLDAEADIETVGEAANVERAVFEALEARPDVVLMDVVMPGKSGIEGMPALLQAVPEVRVSCSRCRTIRSTCARRSRPARAATS
jgi:two-component system response regulator NreC